MSNYEGNRKLDHRYPIIRNGQEVAVPRNQLTLEEREQIIACFRAEAETVLAQAEMLRAELEEREQIIACFRAEAETALAHAEMLRAETDALILGGTL